MRVALLLFGFLRSYKHNYKNLKNSLLDKYKCDIFVHISKDESSNDKYINNNNLSDSIQNVINLYNPISFICEKDTTTISTVSNSIIKYFYKLYQINSLKKHYESLHNFKYDLVILLRPDIYFTNNYQFIESNINLIKTNHLIYPGSELNRIKDTKYSVNDHICIGNSITVNRYCKFYKYLISNNDIISNKSTKTLTSEKLLYQYLIKNNYKYKIDNEIKYKLILSIANSIAVTGDSGSGKSTLSNLINNIFTDTLHIECDRYHKWDRTDPKWKEMTHLNPKANYLMKMREDFFDLKIGNDIYQVDYDHSTGKFTQPNEIKSKSNIVLCGLHTLYDKEITQNMNLNIYLDPDQELKKSWKIQRDIIKRGYTVDQVLEKIKSREEDFKKYISPQKELADMIINYYTVDNLKYYQINKDTKIGLKLYINKNCLESLIFFFDKEKIENTTGIITKKNKVYHYLDLKTDQELVKSKLINYIKESNIQILRPDIGYNLIIQIIISLYFIIN